MSDLRIAVIIPAGGSGVRAGLRKQYADLCGEPLLQRALKPFLETAGVEWIYVALPADDAAAPPDWLTQLDARIEIVVGGADRTASVRSGLSCVPDAADIVLVHDAARPLVTHAIIARTIAAVNGCGAIAAVPVSDTIKDVGDDGVVRATPERSRLWAVQTPQGFPRTLLADAYARAAADGTSATDDATLVERYGGSVVVVQGAPENIKVTTPIDFAVARALIGERAARADRRNDEKAAES